MMMGTYTQPIEAPDLSQYGDQVAQANQYLMGNMAQNTKAVQQAAKAQAAVYNPYYRSALSGFHAGPQYDLTNAQNWSEGLSKGLGNILTGQNYRAEQKHEQQILDDWKAQQAQAQQDAINQQQAEAAHQGETAAWLDKAYPDKGYGDLYRHDPANFGKGFFGHAGDAGGELLYTKPKAAAAAEGTAVGGNTGKLKNVVANNQFLITNGVNPGDANNGQLTPQQQNLYHQVTGDVPVDKLGALNQQNAAWNNASQASALTGSNLDNQGKALANQFNADTLKLRELEQKYTVQGKGLEVQGQGQKLADIRAAREMMERIQEQQNKGKTLTVQDAANADRMMKAAGLDSNYLDSIKAMQNPKAGQSLKSAPGANGYVNLAIPPKATHNGLVQAPSGRWYDPTTKQQVPAPATKPAGKTEKLSNYLPKPKAEAKPDPKIEQQERATLKALEARKASGGWTALTHQEGEQLNQLRHKYPQMGSNGMRLINFDPGTGFF
jgi:hypothetical protein